MILVSCFEPFGGERCNSSLEVCTVLEREQPRGVSFCTLPVVWQLAPNRLLSCIDQLHPTTVLALGQGNQRGVRLETQAINWDDFRIADNAGQKIVGQEIIKGAVDRLETTLPLLELKSSLQAKGVAVALSNSAGRFVCNHLFYSLQHAVAKRGIRSGFVHLPLLKQQLEERGEATDKGMSLEEMTEAVRVMIARLQHLSVGGESGC